MTAFIAQNFVPLMFAGLLFFLLTGIPVAFGLAATGLLFGYVGMSVDLFGANLFQALPQRVFAIMSNDTLLAIPFFTFMGIILERSGMAEDLLETVGQVFGPLRGGLAVAVILVGALLAATTGVVAAAVISMGLISLPIMLRYGYNRIIATGTITASGTLAQAIPPSLVLIVLADQLGKSVGDMYAGALIPGLLLVGLYLLTLALAQVRGRLDDAAEAAALKALRHLPVAVQAVLALEPQVIAWSEEFARKENALFLGRGLHYPIALEGALKLKEISYIHAEAYPAGELKHGPLALVTSAMPVVTVAPNDALLEKLKSNLQEVRARGGELYVFADADTHITSEEGVKVIRLPEHYGALSPILHVVPLQLLAYHTACARGTDVDKPRNLAKSVTVE